MFVSKNCICKAWIKWYSTWKMVLLSQWNGQYLMVIHLLGRKKEKKKRKGKEIENQKLYKLEINKES